MRGSGYLLGAVAIIGAFAGLVIVVSQPEPIEDERILAALACTPEAIRAVSLEDGWFDRARETYGEADDPDPALLARAEAGDAEAMRIIVYVTDDVALRRDWILRGSDAGDPELMMERGHALTRGSDGFVQDGVEARIWLERAMAEDNPLAGTNLYLLYSEYGLAPPDGLSREEAARDALLHSAARCYKSALGMVGVNMASGRDGFPRNRALSNTFLELALARATYP